MQVREARRHRVHAVLQAFGQAEDPDDPGDDRPRQENVVLADVAGLPIEQPPRGAGTAEWAALLDGRRKQFHPAARKSWLEGLQPLRLQFRKQAALVRPLLSHPLLQNRHLDPLSELAARVVELLKLLHDQLSSADLDGVVAPMSLLTPLSRTIDIDLARLSRQFALVAMTLSHAGELEACLQELMGSAQTSARSLRKLARQITADTQQGDADGLIPAPCLPLARLLGDAQIAHSVLLCHALQTARLIVRPALRFAAGREDDLHLLILAALLQDAGSIASGRAVRRGAQEATALNSGQHSACGAALLGSLQDFSIELPFLVAAHHERLDGTGVPNRLTARQLGQPARLLTIAVRFTELLDESAADHNASRGCRPAEDARGASHVEQPLPADPHCEALRDDTAAWLLPAAVQLHREARYGGFDLPLVRTFLESFDAKLAEAVESAACGPVPGGIPESALIDDGPLPEWPLIINGREYRRDPPAPAEELPSGPAWRRQKNDRRKRVVGTDRFSAGADER